MFNPKQALQRIRRSKHQKQQVKQITQGVQPLFATPEQQVQHKPASNIQQRVNKLEMMVMRLTEQLTHSNQTVQKLKRQNSILQTQILKLQYQNSQLKTNQVYSQIRKNSSNKKLTQPIAEYPYEKQYQNFRDPQTQKQKKSQQYYMSASNPIAQASAIQPQKYSIQVQQIIQSIKNQPLQNILKKKQNQFRALKYDQKQVAVGNKYLRELAALEKQYGRCLVKKPVLVIKLDDADFQ